MPEHIPKRPEAAYAKPARPAARGVLTTLLALTTLTLAGPAPAGEIRLPDMGASASTAINPEREREIGEAVVQELRRKRAILDDTEVSTYIQALGYRLVTDSDDPQQRFAFFVVNDSSINAFAVPGGFIGVHTGLILATESESELAAVVAHEIAHVTQKHIARRFEAVDKLTIPSIAALAGAILLSTQSSEAGLAAMAAAQAGAAQFQIDFTRANENEADRVGIQNLARAGYDPGSMPAFFERLQTASRYYTRPPEFLSTHPVTVSRIADSRSRSEQYSYRQRPDSREYNLVKAKLKVLAAETPAQAVSRFAKALESGQYSDQEATRYGLALAMRAGGDLQGARERLAALLHDSPERIAFRSELADTELRLGHQDKAVALFEEGLALYPDNPALVQGYARTLLQGGRAGDARRLLSNFVRDRRPDPKVYWLLARSEEAAGDPVAAHMALAEHYYLMGELPAAVDQLERAEKAGATDFYRSSRISARLQEFKDEVDRRDPKKKRAKGE